MAGKILISLFLLTNIVSSQWVQQQSNTSTTLNNVFFINGNTGSVVGLGGTIRKTTNAGTNWITQTAVADHLYGIHYVNANTGYVCGNDGHISKTIDGGNTWTYLSAPNFLYRGIYFLDASTGFSCGNSGSIVKTTNGGANWTTIPAGTTEFLFNVQFANPTTGYIAGYTGTVLKTTNGGDNWTLLNTGITDLLFGLAIVTSDMVYVSGENGKIIKTTNGGANWTQLSSGVGARLANLSFVNANTGTASCHFNIILKTTNGGATWFQQASGLTGQDFNGVFFTSALSGYVVGTNGNILATTTGGFPIPPAPVLTLPVNGAVNVSLTPLLDWDSASGANYYHLQLATDTIYNSPVIDSGNIPLTSLNVPSGLLNNNTLYYWRVRGLNPGATGAWSVNFRFRTIVALPTAPNLLLPVNAATNVSLTPFFDWDSTSPADYYTLQASLDTSFTNLQVFTDGILHSFLQQTAPLYPNFRYYWRVKATNPAGSGPYSNVFYFNTQTGPPAAPVLLYPANGAIGINLTPTLDWIDDYSVTSYQTQLSTDSLFGTTIIDSTGFTASQLTVRPGLLTNVMTYYWRVRTTNSLGTSPWSATWKFLTLLSAPAVPNLIAPPNNSVDISTTPTLDWDSVPFAETYRVQLSTDAGFGSFVFNIGGLTASQYNVPGGALNYNTVYYWRVNATNQAGTSPFSTVFNFRTVASPPVAAPTLLAPPNGSINLPLNPTLDWNDVFGSNGYRVLVAVDSFFNTTVIDTSIVPSQVTIPLGILAGSTNYYWRVRGFNAGGFGPWSVTWRFRTGPVGITQLGTEIPKQFRLYNNYPNPFNPVTKIKFDLPRSAYVTIQVYDLAGRMVSILVNENLSAGVFETSWDASKLASGVYIYRIITPYFTDVKKMVVVK